jgi:hypothetical protein
MNANPPSLNHVNDNKPAPQLTPPADVQHPNVITQITPKLLNDDQYADHEEDDAIGEQKSNLFNVEEMNDDAVEESKREDGQDDLLDGEEKNDEVFDESKLDDGEKPWSKEE